MSKQRQPGEDQVTTQTAQQSDVGTIEDLVQAVYDSISGPAGTPRDWDRFKSLFMPDAEMVLASPIVEGDPAPAAMHVDGYVEAVSGRFEAKGFFEQGISMRAETFGNAAHVWSVFESRRSLKDTEPLARGINSFQLIFNRNRWWIVSVLWDYERPDNQIPEEYLP